MIEIMNSGYEKVPRWVFKSEPAGGLAMVGERSETSKQKEIELDLRK